MEDQALEVEIPSKDCDDLECSSTCRPDPTVVNCEAEKNEGNIASCNSEALCSEQEQILPVLRKYEDVAGKLMNLRKEHATLRNKVKGITADDLLGSEVLNAIQRLSAEYELLKKKYLQECFERRRLYNEVIELKGNIRVFCRCRPLNQDEIAKEYASIVDFESSEENELQIVCDSSKKHFKFDHVFTPEDDQEAVFLQTKPIIRSVLDGYNVCIFAYGQTGTGKTFTMEGIPENRGVNYRTLEELFRLSNERSGTTRYELYVSMLEVYNERIRDLLAENSNQPARKLEIKQSAEGNQEVPGLYEVRAYNSDEVWDLLKSGSKVRSVGSTNANEQSSRSHCLLRVTVVGENLINGIRTRSHLWLVDLAGSERVGRIEVEGERLKESQFINRSLSALGDVISALASRNAHVPYRNSKLTHMLQSSLGGDCKTLMFVHISPSVADSGETLCSLNFASRVRGIEHGPVRKQADLTELAKYKQLAEKAKNDEKEAKKLRDSLQSVQLRLAAKEHACKSLQEKVRDLDNQLAEERKMRLKQESRALAAVSAQPSSLSSFNQSQKPMTDKKPPLGSSKLRLPLRRITNFMPQSSSPVPPKETKASMLPLPPYNKENLSRTTSMPVAKASVLLKPRRGSIAVRPTPPATAATHQVLQPRRRASIGTMRPEPNPNITTPLNSSMAKMRNNRVMGRQSFVWDPQRIWRTSRINSPLGQVKENSCAVEATPIGPRSSSKFRASPPSQAGSWRPKHPTVIALQKKHLVWSPLKLRGIKNINRKSILPS